MGDGFSRRDAIAILCGAGVLFAGGTLGFMWILGESWDAALYRTIVSASLTGLDSTPRGVKAEALTILVVLSGVALFGYFAAQLFDEIAHGIFGGGRRARKRQRMIDQLRDHIIVCGYGRVGRRAAAEFRAADVRYVVLDFSEEAIAAAEANGDLYVRGDGSKDEDLQRAGIDRSRRCGGGMEPRRDQEHQGTQCRQKAKTKSAIIGHRSNSAKTAMVLSLSQSGRQN